ncbi:PREDICTED: kinesin-like protein KIF6 [Thamnophis sirtalis]|uniref:Kinesin-like protein n=1 Tax=Thamnophis sirtalis TaxID=35019 RepID=A0A6I9YR51_9SAUR|nr:PREDICTED: kinesin-like protein KIF6 [Thamnophis sirtalis]
MVKQTIQIYARVKPLGKRQTLGIYSVDENETSGFGLEIIVPRDLSDGFVNNKRESYKFKFQKVFDQESKQDDIFETIAKPVAECVLSGYNGTIFAYGQTGSGKTFTITGGAERYSDRGIIPRTLSYIFQRLQKDISKVYTTHISYLEIYNECGYDLLDPRHEASNLEDLPKVTIMEDPDQNIHLKHLSLQQATNEEEALNLLFLGDTNRMIAETPMNQASTRSHCIFTIHISSKEPGSATIRRSKLHLVDLAGSERVGKTGVGGQQLTEAKYINLSLHYLEQVIIALSEKNRSHIPYRNSMMTSVLRDSLGGNCMTTMIATLSVEKRNIDESISTCRFAQRVAVIKNEAVLNEEIDPGLMIMRLKKEIQELKNELAMVTGEQRFEELSKEELLELDEQVKEFLEDTDPENVLEIGADMRKIKYCFSHLKPGVGKEMSLGRQEAFEIFKRDYVDSITIEDNKQLLKQRFAEAKSLGQKVNDVRNQINHLKEEIIQRHMQKAAQALISPREMNQPDPVEEGLRSQIEQKKISYKTMFTHLKGLKIEIEHLQLLMEKAKVKLQKDFEAWWSEETKSLQSQEETSLLQNSTSVLKTLPLFFENQLYPGTLRVPNNSRASSNEQSTVQSSVSRLSNSNSQMRISQDPSSTIPFTGDRQTDADIIAFIRARKNLLHKKGNSYSNC